VTALSAKSTSGLVDPQETALEEREEFERAAQGTGVRSDEWELETAGPVHLLLDLPFVLG